MDTAHLGEDHVPADNVLAYGSGLKSVKRDSLVPTTFYVDCRNCDGPSTLTPEIEVLDDKKQPIASDVKPTNTPRLFEASFDTLDNPSSECFYPKVTYDSNNIPGSPFVVPLESTEIPLHAPGLIDGLQKSKYLHILCHLYIYM